MKRAGIVNDSGFPDCIMQNFKLTLEYDGTNYQGFQIQKNGNTIQAELEKALQKLFQTPIRITSCGRTDTGVHAVGHVINFKVKTKIPLSNILRAVNSYLPEDIAIQKIVKVPLAFHSRFDAKSKIYEYRILNEAIRSPLEARQATFISQPLDVAAMKAALKCLEGKHDFRAFASKTAPEKNTTRRMDQATLQKKGKRIFLRFEANGFLYNMVRNIVGTLLLVGTGKISATQFKKILESKNRTAAGAVAPPEGLHLIRVKY